MYPELIRFPSQHHHCTGWPAVCCFRVSGMSNILYAHFFLGIQMSPPTLGVAGYMQSFRSHLHFRKCNIYDSMCLTPDFSGSGRVCWVSDLSVCLSVCQIVAGFLLPNACKLIFKALVHISVSPKRFITESVGAWADHAISCWPKVVCPCGRTHLAKTTRPEPLKQTCMYFSCYLYICCREIRDQISSLRALFRTKSF